MAEEIRNIMKHISFGEGYHVYHMNRKDHATTNPPLTQLIISAKNPEIPRKSLDHGPTIDTDAGAFSTDAGRTTRSHSLLKAREF